MIDEQDWTEVPSAVAAVYSRAAKVAADVRSRATQPCVYWWCPETEALLPVTPEEPERYIKIAAGGLLADTLQFAGQPFGGPVPLTNSIVGGLLGAGAGYVGGTVAEQLLPEQQFEKGRFRHTMALLGGGLGAFPGLWQGLNRMQQNDIAGKPLGLSGFVTPNAAVGPHPELDPQIGKQVQGSAALELLPVPVDAFNRAIWNDVGNPAAASRNPFGTKDAWGDNTQSLRTPPPVAAAASGLVTGVSEMFGGQQLLTPRHFINGLAAAGVDGLTARAAGTVLGALGGMRPAAQQQLQQVGLWGGLVRGVVQSVFGGGR